MLATSDLFVIKVTNNELKPNLSITPIGILVAVRTNTLFIDEVLLLI